MFLIGEFSKIAQVSARMLRHYDAIGLFRPERVDPETGYRFYSARQLPELNRILALKMMGLELDEVRRIVAEGVSDDQIRGIFKARKAKLEADLERERARLRLVASRLEQLDRGAPAPEVIVKPVPAQPALTLRETARDFAAMDALIRGAHEALAEAGRNDGDGPMLALFHDQDFEMAQIDWEYGLAQGGSGKGRRTLELPDGRALELRRLPPIDRAACLIHEGPWFSLHRGYSAVGTWIEANGYRIVGVGREVFWNVDPERPEGNVTEIQFPVEEA